MHEFRVDVLAAERIVLYVFPPKSQQTMQARDAAGAGKKFLCEASCQHIQHPGLVVPRSIVVTSTSKTTIE